MDLSGIEAAMYLRKSRAEDGMDASEILRRHQETLSEYAARNGVRIVETYQEIQSGESLYSRTEMIRLLGDVEAGRFQAVLCMDIDRLSRGEAIERSFIWNVFKETGTLIITPSQVYDLSKKSDALMTELRGVFASFELDRIKERTQQGLIRAAKEGCYLPHPPYGYRRKVVGRKQTLEPYEPEARFVRLAFDMYASGAGCDVIAQRLTAEGARPKYADAFSGRTVLKMIKNPAYAGRIVYNRERWTRKNGKIVVTRRPESEWAQADGIHTALVSPEQWEQCQEIMKSRWRPPYFEGTITNPFAGLIRCKQCGSRMYRHETVVRCALYCRKHGCHCVSSNFALVESAIMEGLREILSGFETEPAEQSQNAVTEAEARLESIRAAIASERRKMAKLYDFLESGTYTEEMFRERMKAAEKRVDAVREQERAALKDLDALSKRNAEQQAAGIKTLLEEYADADAPTKNALLRGIVDVIWYNRETRNAPFSIEIFLR